MDKPRLKIISRGWQEECRLEQEKALASGKKSFFLAAGVGSGKTTQALSFFLSCDFDVFVVIAPRVGILGSWQEDGEKLDLALSTIESASSKSCLVDGCKSCHGYLMTPGMAASLSDALKTLCLEKKVLLVLDEGHHYAVDMAWGDALYDATINAHFRLGLSGTPYRTDENKIACLMYGEHHSADALQGMPEYIYTYEQSLADGHVTPIVTRFIGGTINVNNSGAIEHYDFYDGDYSKQFGNKNKELIARRLRLATEESFDWQTGAIKVAREKLLEYRVNDETHWAGLIICSTIAQADRIVEHIKKFYGDSVEGIYDDMQTIEAVKRANRNPIDWVVSISKVSEGVSIPKLRVALSLSVVTTRTFFEQTRGRLARKFGDTPGIDQPATFFIPKNPRLVSYALTSNSLTSDIISKLPQINETPRLKDMKYDLELNEDELTTCAGVYEVKGTAYLDGAVDAEGNLVEEDEIATLREEIVSMGLSDLNIANYSIDQLRQTKALWQSI